MEIAMMNLYDSIYVAISFLDKRGVLRHILHDSYVEKSQIISAFTSGIWDVNVLLKTFFNIYIVSNYICPPLIISEFLIDVFI